MRLKDKVAFVTDADSSSGRAVATRFADEGAHLILNSVSNGEQIESTLEHCRRAGRQTLVVNVNLCQSSEVEHVLTTALAVVGYVDILVHNNNLVRPISIETGEEDVFLEIMNTNAKTAFVCTKVVGRQMAVKRSGKVIYVTSIHAEKPTGSSFAYSASKSAVKMLAREASLVFGRFGVNVNTVEFGPAEGDDAVFKSDISTLYDSYQYKVPNKVLGTHGDIANLVLFLSSDEARYLNGADIRLDGGFLMHYLDFKMRKPESEIPLTPEHGYARLSRFL